MKSIFKYVLNPFDSQVIEIQSETILGAEEQNEKIVVYAIVDTNIKPIKYEFGINGTGNPITFELEHFKFLNTVKIYGGKLMLHVFYRKTI